MIKGITILFFKTNHQFQQLITVNQSLLLKANYKHPKLLHVFKKCQKKID